MLDGLTIDVVFTKIRQKALEMFDLANAKAMVRPFTYHAID